MNLNNQIILSITIATRQTLYFAFLMLVACANPNSDASSDENSQLHEMSGHNPKNPNARYLVSAQGEMDGKIIRGSKVSFSLIQEYDSSKHLLNETTSNNALKFIQHFNAEGKLMKLESFENDSPSIYQENKYDQAGQILREFRLEYGDDGIDTILYEYHYKYSIDSLTYLAFRTNNGDTVTRYTMEKKGNHTYKTEEAYPYRGFTIINEEDLTQNDKGELVSLLQRHISNDRKDEPLDTTISSSTYLYNDAGKLIEERNENDIFKANRIKYKYKNDMISERTIDGTIVKFEQYVLPK